MKPACFLKVKQKLTGRGCQNNATVRGFKREGKNLRLEERSFDFLSFEGKHMDLGASKPMLRRFEIRHLCDKMRPFCTI